MPLWIDDGNIKVSSVLTGSPAWKSGEVQVGDIIMKVAQGNEEPVDLTGYVVTDAVKIIRGKRHRSKTDHQETGWSNQGLITIRDEIVQDETFARSAIVKNGSSKIGYIFPPEFYADFDHPNGNRSFVDVAKRSYQTQGRKSRWYYHRPRNNSGGSLYDVVQMAGLFIEDGPIVFYRWKTGTISQAY